MGLAQARHTPLSSRGAALLDISQLPDGPLLACSVETAFFFAPPTGFASICKPPGGIAPPLRSTHGAALRHPAFVTLGSKPGCAETVVARVGGHNPSWPADALAPRRRPCWLCNVVLVVDRDIYNYTSAAAAAFARSCFRHAVIVMSPMRSSGGGFASAHEVNVGPHICVSSGPWPYISQSSRPQFAKARSMRSWSPAGQRPSSEQSSAPWYDCPARRAAPE